MKDISKTGIILVILMLFLFHSVGFFVVFELARYEIKTEIKKQIKKAVPDNLLCEIKFPNRINADREAGLRWEDEKEFWYDGSMYDVVRTRITNDTISYYCINDSKETQLFAGLHRQVDEQLSQPDKSTQTTKNIKLAYDQNYLPGSTFLYNNLFLFAVRYTTETYSFPSYIPDKEGPPPKQA